MQVRNPKVNHIVNFSIKLTELTLPILLTHFPGSLRLALHSRSRDAAVEITKIQTQRQLIGLIKPDRLALSLDFSDNYFVLSSIFHHICDDLFGRTIVR